MRMSEKCRNNNSENPLTSRRTDGGKNHNDSGYSVQLYLWQCYCDIIKVTDKSPFSDIIYQWLYVHEKTFTIGTGMTVSFPF